MAKRIFFALLLSAIAGLRQPVLAAGTGAGKSSQADSKSGAPQKTPSDAQIEQAIRIKLAKSKMSADHFTVSVVKGVAIIEGSTGVMQHKGAMTRMAKAAGATSVRNNIRISDDAKAKAVQSLAKSRAAVGESGATGAKAAGAPDGATPSAESLPRATVIRQTTSH